MKVAIIMPSMETEDRGYWREAVNSIANQTFDPRQIVLIQVIRYTIGHDVPSGEIDDRIGRTVIVGYPTGSEEPISDMAQMGVGFEVAVRDVGVEYVMMCPANDILGETLVADSVAALQSNPQAQVAYCDYTMFKGNYPLEKTLSLRAAITLDEMVKQDHVPDYSMFRRELYVDIPFDSRYKRVSYWVWWITVLRKYGSGAFVHVPRANFRYRWGHEGQTSQDTSYKDGGAGIMTRWLKDQGLIGESVRLHY